MRRGAGDLEGNQEGGARARHGFDDMPIVGAGGTTGHGLLQPPSCRTRRRATLLACAVAKSMYSCRLNLLHTTSHLRCRDKVQQSICLKKVSRPFKFEPWYPTIG